MGKSIKMFVCGDIMTGRGIDQLFCTSSDPTLQEDYMTDARGYLMLAERKHGPIIKPVTFDYIWGDALAIFDLMNPKLKIINLETSITLSQHFEKKGINYRMHPQNVSCLTAANIDFCALANNHVLDWGREGLIETLQTLEKAGIQYAGAGKNIFEAKSPAIFNFPTNVRIIIFSLGFLNSGIPEHWAATQTKAGVYCIQNSKRDLEEIQHLISKIKQKNVLVIVSIHWGTNWNYEIMDEEKHFARGLIDAGANMIYGHSSHHFKAIEVYKNKLILYGCGDLINDYEGISGHEEYRGDLGILYFPEFDSTRGELISLQMFPLQIQRCRLQTPSEKDLIFVLNTLNQQSKIFGTSFRFSDDNKSLLM